LLARGHVEQVLQTAAGQAGLPEFETEATLRSGLERGLAQPWVPQWPVTPSAGPSNHPIEPPNDLPQNNLPLSERRSGARRRHVERRAVQTLDPWAFPTTDTGNAERLVARHGRDLHYCHPWQKWLAWDGRRWRTDSTAEVRRHAKETTRSIYAEATALTGDGPEAEARRKDLGSWARRTEARERRSAMLELAQSEEGIPVLPEQFDADPWLLNCLNGTLDLRTGTLRSHQQNDLLTKLCPVAYDAEAICPTWLAFLRVITRGNEELIRFLQRFMGYAMTGVVWEHVLLVCYGTGSNGKSTFLETLVGLLGDYAWQAPPDLLMLKSLDTHPTEMAGLFGVRFAACIETASGRRLDEARMKMLTGGDRVTVRRMREDFWTFRPTHKLALGTNHKPLVATTDHGTWRRQKLVPFTVTIPSEQQDKRLPERLKAEFSGILRWALVGCLAWQRDGLGNAEAIREATEAWRDESDALGGFLHSCCALTPRGTVAAKELYRAYLVHCEANGEEPLKQKPFGQRLGEHGFAAIKGTGGVRLWRGLRLAEVANG
jgi:putative DNA primase/helicase